MPASPLLQLREFGQSPWVDHLRRRFIVAGHLGRLIREDGVRGQTPGPGSFAGAVGGSSDYDEDLARLAGEGLGTQELYEALVVEDLRLAADALAAVHEETGGADGFVCFDLAPHLAHDAGGTVAECRRLVCRIDRPNVMVEVPATDAGIAATEALTAEGRCVNATLLFSVEAYRRVAEAYLRGLERLLEAGGDPAGVASVASFSLCALDALVDDLLGDRMGAGPEAERAASLLGSVAVANAKLAYRAHREIFKGTRWRRLARKGARPQRLLWAGTATKSPRFGDLRYVEALVGPDTVIAMAPATLAAFRDHGVAAATLEEGVEEAAETVAALGELGIDLAAVARRLLDEGIEGRRRRFEEAVNAVASRSRQVLEGGREAQVLVLGDLGSGVEEAAGAAEKEGLVRRLWEKDASLWSSAPELQEAIRGRLGWLDLVEAMLEESRPARRFGDTVRASELRRALLLGMGGSSLSPEVCRRVFGAAGFEVLDSTVPSVVAEVMGRFDPASTLVLVSSKSGTTIETRALADAFYERAAAVRPDPGLRFVAITDPHSPLEVVAQERGFGRVWLNPADVGGRSSALCHFGLVPMAIMGVDVGTLLGRARRMAQSCAPEVPARENPGLMLGLVLGHCHRVGRNKVTFLASPGLAPFAEWVEQLLAESTGKDGRGLVPVVGEPPGKAGAYGGDRLFVALRLAGEAEGPEEERLAALAAAGHPVVRILLDDPYDLGGEFFRWEVAAAVAGRLMGVNPFDEPNVEESKQRTAALLQRFEEQEALPEGRPAWEGRRAAVYADLEADPELAERIGDETGLAAWMAAHLGRARPGDYLALQAFLAPVPEAEAALQRIRRTVRDRLRIATTLGWGPRYLHSTGQLHKGGPDQGLFLQLTADDAEDVSIPGRPYGFGILARAQALGDLQALRARGRRALRVHLGGDPVGNLVRLAEAVEAALE